jgi:hypothetical protein
MARRADPARIDAAKRAAIAGRLGDSRMQPDTVERWLVAWEAVGEDWLAGDFWDRGYAWVTEQRAAGRRGP